MGPARGEGTVTAGDPLLVTGGVVGVPGRTGTSPPLGCICWCNVGIIWLPPAMDTVVDGICTVGCDGLRTAVAMVPDLGAARADAAAAPRNITNRQFRTWTYNRLNSMKEIAYVRIDVCKFFHKVTMFSTRFSIIKSPGEIEF